MSIRVLVADDHAVVRRGIHDLLRDSDIEIIGEAGDGKQAVAMANKHHPDVILLDIRMQNGDGLEALESIRTQMPDAKVVMLSTYDNPTYVARAVALGASDYVLKGSSRDAIVSTIKAAAEGASPVSEGKLQSVATTMGTRQKFNDVPLTNRETQVLRHVALGLSNKEIGQSLGISIETVKEHVQNILRKLDVTDRTQAAVWAVRHGLVE